MTNHIPEMTPLPAKKVLFIGWDGADWQMIDPLMDAGKMPNLNRLVNQGVMGNVSTLSPTLSPILWTSIATGKRPFKHGIHGFTEPDPHGGGIRPITAVARKTKAVWNILSQNERKCVVVSWWPSHPAEPINGVMVSNHYQRAVAPYGNPWPVRPGTVHPPRLDENLAELRTHPQELDPRLIQGFVPRLADIDQEKDRRIETMARLIAESITVKDAACAIMHYEPWDFSAVYFDSIDRFCHFFMPYHPPRLSWVDKTDFKRYRHVVESGYMLLDAHLGTLLRVAGEDVTVILVSDHGFHSGRLRPGSALHHQSTPASQHRPHGIFVMKGAGIKKDEILHGAGLLDLVPTVLMLFGLPVGLDLDGAPLVNVFEAPPRIRTIPSWDDVPGEDGRHPENLRMDPTDAREGINQLVVLGYIEKPEEDQEKAVVQTVRELRFNLAVSYMDAGRHTEAIPYLEDLRSESPDQDRFTLALAQAYLATDQIPSARRILEDLSERKKAQAARAGRELAKMKGKLGDKRPEDLSEPERERLFRLTVEANQNLNTPEHLMARVCLAEGDEKSALDHLGKAEKAGAETPELLLNTGRIYLNMKRWEDADRRFKRVLRLDPENADAHLGRCRALLHRRSNLFASDAALKAVALKFHNPSAHYLLGIALHRMGRLTQAVEALNVAVSQNPNFKEAYERLAYIHEHRLDSPGPAAEYRQKAEEAAERLKKLREGKVPPEEIKPTAGTAGTSDQSPGKVLPVDRADAFLLGDDRVVTIVSGLPRSGTSLMMQMLKAGGLSLLVDASRPADADNPRGYFEWEKAKKLQKDRTWLPEAGGKAVKIVAQLLMFLPGETSCRVVFMERDLEEVVRSQRKMLERQGKRGSNIPDERLKAVFAGQVETTRQLLLNRKIPTLYMHYAQCIENPFAAAKAINDFFGGTLDEKAMAETVDPVLYRQRV
ncbi:MAG: alkaline phosphatase family protein [Deltaproteobacteria bacterium]|nr:alkaline phosphatase family protein [Deltaproteobacteria bacterium]